MVYGTYDNTPYPIRSGSGFAAVCIVVVIIPWRNLSVPALDPALCPGTAELKPDPNLGAAFLYLPLIYHTCPGTVKLRLDPNPGVAFLNLLFNARKHIFISSHCFCLQLVWYLFRIRPCGWIESGSEPVQALLNRIRIRTLA